MTVSLAFILNSSSGEVYECTFSMPHFAQWLEDQEDCTNFVQVCHWAIVHIQSTQFAEQVIRSLSSQKMQCSGGDVLKEYMIANIFMQCKSNPDFQKDFLALLRISVQEFTTKPSLYDMLAATKEWKSAILPPKFFAPLGADTSQNKYPMLNVLDAATNENEAFTSSWKHLVSESLHL